MIDYVLSVDTFEEQCDVLKGMLQSLRLKDHVKAVKSGTTPWTLEPKRKIY